VAEEPALRFAGLLRQLRSEARLTQEELAEAASLSPRSVSDLERGINLTAHKETAMLLAGALGLVDPVRALFVAAARGRAPAAEVLQARDSAAAGGAAAAATRTLPRDIASFTWRGAELTRLAGAVAGATAGGGVVGIHAIGGMAGIGKTTLAVHAAHQLAPRFPDGQFFLPLHAHTPGQRPVDPADALASLLLTAGVAAQQIPPGLEARAGRWRDCLAGKKVLLLLDDAAGHEQVRPLLPGTAGSLVLVTSRRHLTALEDAQAISLDTLAPAEAAELLIRLAARPGLDPGDPAVREITRLCGYLPLAVGMLARQLHHHPAWTPAALAADLAAARDRLELMSAENLSVAAAFDLSYQDLTPGQQRLFRRLGLHPGTDIDGYAAAALDHAELGTTRHLLEALYDQHLLTEPARGRYRPHDLIREHARTLAAADPVAETAAALGRLLDYYLHAARAAGQHLPPSTPARVPAVTANPPAHAPGMATREDAVTWMNNERLNLHAAAGYAASHNRPGHAIAIPAAMHGYLRSRGYWDQAVSLHRAALQMARHAGDRLAEAGALNHLGDMQYLVADYPAATASLTRALELYRGLGDRLGQAGALNQLGIVQYQTDNYPAATASLTRALELYRGLGDRLGEASALNQLGIVQYLTGDYPAAVSGLTRALELCRQVGDQFGEADAVNQLGVVQDLIGDYPAARASHEQALDIFRDLGDRRGQASAIGNLGVVHQATGDYAAAVASYEQALELFRDLGNRLGEANSLNYLGLVQQATGDYVAAAASQARALQMYRDLSDLLGEAEILNNMGELSLASSTSADALARHGQALAIAADIASPLEEARALEGIGRCYIQDGQPDHGAARLREALAIYRRIGSPAAGRVERTLSDHVI
jgi:tetratricopeptide (TPR) repeat protein/transcriptional regulator with XRE-family HTH domain